MSSEAQRVNKSIFGVVRYIEGVGYTSSHEDMPQKKSDII